MMKLHSVEVKTLTPEIFRMFQVNTALLTAGDEKHLNTMTIGWGQLGTLWNLPVCTVYVRPERYTYEFMEAQDTFSVSVLPDSAGTLPVCAAPAAAGRWTRCPPAI